MAAKMTLQWASGSGPVRRAFGGDTPQTSSMRTSLGVGKARELFYEKNANALKTGSELQPVTNFGSAFGLTGAFRAGLNPTQQFVGSYDVEIVPSTDGQTIHFTVTNVTSMTSAAYKQAPLWERSSFGPGGNMTQTYEWDEKIEQPSGGK
ncbi:MAG: hypothetical protein AB7N70_37025 [Dehalococcoidia bacterium]